MKLSIILLSALLMFFLQDGFAQTQVGAGSHVTYILDEQDVPYESYHWEVSGGYLDPQHSPIKSGNIFKAFVIWGAPGSGSVTLYATPQFSPEQIIYFEAVTIISNCATPATPNTDFTFQVGCRSVTVVRSSTAPSGDTWYWQTSPDGTEANDGSNDGSSYSYGGSGGGTYYLRPRKTLNTYCWGNAISFTLPVSISPTEPTLGSSDYVRCGPGTIDLSATAGAQANQVKWYDTSGTVIGDQPQLSRYVSEPTSFFVASYNSFATCESTWKSVFVDVRPIPGAVASVSITPTSLCGSGNVSFSATGLSSGETFYWYEVASSVGQPLTATTEGFSMAYPNNPISSDKTFWVGRHNVSSGCVGPLTSVTASVNQNFTFTASLYNPGTVCEGQPSSMGVTTNTTRATYKWYDPDNTSTVLSTLQYPVNIPAAPGKSYSVQVQPDTTIPCLVNPSFITVGVPFTVINVRPKVNNLTITVPANSDPRCTTNVSNTVFTAKANSVDSYGNWQVLPPEAGTLTSNDVTVNGQLQSVGTLAWSPSYVGTATISVKAYGCNLSEVTQFAQITVQSPPTAFNLIGTDYLCAVGSPLGKSQGVLQLSGSEPGVTYAISSGTPFSPQVSPPKWTVTGPGNYSVTATRGVCSPVNTINKTINLQPPAVFQIAGNTNICESQNFQLQVTNGAAAPENLTWLIQDVTVTGASIDQTPVVGMSHITVQGNESYCSTFRSQSIPVSVTAKLNSVNINSDNIDFRCNGQGTNAISFSYDGELLTQDWSLTASNMSPGNINPHGVITWDSQFTGTATVTLIGGGCNGPLAPVYGEIIVVPVPAHKALSVPSNSVCPDATIQMNLSNIGSRETYELFTVTNNAGTETTTLVGSPGSAPNWNVGPGTFYVRSMAPNCPTDITERITINPIVHNMTLQTNTGTITANGSDYDLAACADALVTLTVLEGTGYKWYRHNGVCDTQNTAVIPPNQLFDYCNQKILNADGTTTDGSNTRTFKMGFMPKLLLTGNEAVCNRPFAVYINMQTTPRLQFNSLIPDYTARLEGAGTDSLGIDYTGLKYDETWSFTPPEAGSMTPQGVVTWNPTWNSFLGPTVKPAVVTLGLKSCAGWEYHPIEIEVEPILAADENRVRTYVTKQAIQNYASLLTEIENTNAVNVNAGYFDGLGRNVQNVQYFGSSTAKDLVDLKRYDEYGREAVKNLPFAGNHSLAYRQQAIIQHADFFQNPPPTVQGDESPFAKTVFEPSPLNRVVEQGAPGAAWQPGTGHTITKKYEFNNLNEVYLFKYDSMTGSVSLAATEADKYYSPNQLYANKTYDEHNNEVIEYTDKEGRTVCKKVYVETVNSVKQYASTYYLYDDFGSLVVVLPPEGVKALTN